MRGRERERERQRETERDREKEGERERENIKRNELGRETWKEGEVKKLVRGSFGLNRI